MSEMDANSWSEHRFYRRDPLPHIEPALLSSADIARYVDLGCLLEKHNFHSNRLKPASYEMRLLGQLFFWENVGGRLRKRCSAVEEGQPVKLPKNSISYLWTRERLRLPEYIAARFNLRIRDVHKGILLGTGPLVDPGFGGQILVPLHNLTDNDYVLKGGKGIIWVEFTKVSRSSFWSYPEEAKRPDGLVTFPNDKRIENPDGYFVKADAATGVQSAFKGELDHTARLAKDAHADSTAATQKVGELERRIRSWGLGGAVTGVVAIAALVISAYSLTFPIADKVHDQANRIHDVEKTLQELLDSRSIVSATEPIDKGSDELEGLDLRAEEEADGERTPGDQVGSRSSEEKQSSG